MTDTRWDRIQTLFEAARARAPNERLPFLAQVCDDPELRELVAEMLASSESDALSVESKFLVPDHHETEAQPNPKTIGGYRILRQLGRGGMADVFLADPDRPSDGEPIAIKVLRQARSSSEMARRLEAEANFLSRLDHPNIARFRGAGVTSDGLPYVAMTYVDGEALLQYVERARPSLTERLSLFRTICSAIQHAHDAGVLHRDLKPSNVLVTHEGKVVLLDFGIGKFLSESPDGGPAPVVTPAGVRLLTPSHAAPEQVNGQPPSVRTDVYGLGLLLYELLTGKAALSAHGLNWLEWERRVLDVDPPFPSEVARSTEPEDQEQLRAALRGGLDSIVMKAIRKDPMQRFDSAEAFSARLQAHTATAHP